jgi:hypothetical protein
MLFCINAGYQLCSTSDTDSGSVNGWKWIRQVQLLELSYVLHVTVVKFVCVMLMSVSL